MAYGLNSWGMDIPTLTEIIEERKQTYRERFGQNINLAVNSYLDKIVTIESEREHALWELLEAVYYSQTSSGAEAKYLDDIYSKQGVYRKKATASSGNVILGFNSSAANTYTIESGAYTILNGTYTNTSSVVLQSNIVGQLIKNTDLVSGTYNFYMLDSNSTLQTLSLSLTNTTAGSLQLNSFFNAIRDFIIEYSTDDNSSRISVDTASGILYIGYDDSLNLIGLKSSITFYSDVIAGTRFVSVEFKANTTGYNLVLAGTVSSISPSIASCTYINNVKDFSTGSDIETDSEYRARASVPESTGKATRPAIRTGLYNAVSDLQNVKIYANPTDHVSTAGVPPYSLMIVTYGGTTSAICEAIYSLIGIPTNTYGTVGYTKTTEDNNTETIYYTPATPRPLSVRVNYKAINGKQLSTAEKNAIITQLNTLAKSFDINATVFNLQLQSAVVAGVNISRFKQLVVEVKDASAGDKTYTTADIVTGVTELCTLSESNIIFNVIN